MTRRLARQLDEQDPLADYLDRFLPGDDSVRAYLDGNSLGRPPKATVAAIEDCLHKQWGTRLIRSWTEEWLALPTVVGDELGTTVLRAAPGQTVVADSTTVCLYKLLRAACALRPGRTEIVTDVHNFPTDRYVVEGIASELGMTLRWLEPPIRGGITPELLAPVLGAQTAVVTFSHVAYQSAAIADMAGITARVHDVGALVVWDLCHSAGAIPVDLDTARADFAVGCTYKYLNGGPGAPAFLYVNHAVQERFHQPIQGWIGRADPFAMAQGYLPAPGVSRALSGTPNVLGLIAVREGVRLVTEAGIERIRAKGIALTELAVRLTEQHLAPLGFTLGSPRRAEDRGNHITICHPNGKALAEQLTAAGILVDFREPDGIRFGCSPLTTRFSDLPVAVEALADLASATG
ncbi:kynureninase [Tamaricihabitans halophyticus]|uniref:Kynureninase n=1 Tax=Tamaricihabitans halophyticus TaxID=1262583 RepID=A0A4R2QA77_9PSEU|nr:aminotransferase class V-fold PLP-dependent enzyme [Tamaricihabitans halophyticus]TCP45830.1 kynureninase [Tamaricihabitans halophyticus]